MAHRVYIFIFIVFSLFTTGCHKAETETIQPPTKNDPEQYGTPFAEIPVTSDIVMYEINERAFSVSGNLTGIIPRLDSIKALGVNVIWLMPVHPIGSVKSVNSPYCIKNFKEVNPEYGTLDDLRNLVNQAHQRKMAVILDWAANHTSWDNPWIQNKSWYTQDNNGNIISPAGTNWQDVADLNYDNATMKKEMISAMKYWVLHANIDGFRCDAADFVPFTFWKQAIDTLIKIPNRRLIMLAEGARKDHFNAGFQMNFAWDFFNKNKNVFKNNHSVAGFFLTHQSEYAGTPANVHKLRFTSNHDECAWDDTPIGLFGGKAASLAAFTLTITMGGVPLIYNGQEIGYPVKLPFFSKSPINWNTNPDMLQEYKRLMSVRQANPALRSGTTEDFSTADIAVYQRKTGNNEVLVLVNTRPATKTLSVPASLKNSGWKDTKTNTTVQLESTVSLNAFEYRILVK
ncbi:MAG: alpha-amylase [Saprospiraceae bacterium]|nr:alpha-amylase [Saprospiraceae bacterium]